MDTTRTRSELVELFHDNNDGDITAQDMRDFVASVQTTGEAAIVTDALGNRIVDVTNLTGTKADAVALQALVDTVDGLGDVYVSQFQYTVVQDHLQAHDEAIDELQQTKADLSGANFSGMVEAQGFSIGGGDALSIDSGGNIAMATGGASLNVNSGYITGAYQIFANEFYGNGSNITGLTQSQISGLASALAAKAPLASPTFTGTVTAGTINATTLQQNGQPLSSILGGYVSTGALASTLTNYVTTSSLGTTLASYLTTSSAAATYATASALTTHTGNTSNPHSVTASQTGAYSTSQADTLLAAKAPLASPTFTTQITTPKVAITGKTPSFATSLNRCTFNEPVGGPANETGMVYQFSSGGLGNRCVFAITHTSTNTAFFGLNGPTFTIGSEGNTDIIFRKSMSYGSADILGSGTQTVKIVGATGMLQADFGIVGPINKSAIMVATGTGMSIDGPGFNTVPLSTEVTDNGNNYNPATYIYSVPTSGVYEINCKLRLNDETEPYISYGIGAGTSNADGPHFSWYATNATSRQGAFYSRTAAFVAGDQIRMYCYLDSSQTFEGVTGEMTICLVSPN